MIEFHKMHVLGNDFIIADNMRENKLFSHDDIIRLSSRRLGIGCDQFIIINKSDLNDIDCKILIYNKDGSISKTCVNGTKCVAYLMYIKSKKNTLNIMTDSALRPCKLDQNGKVTINMGKPITTWNEIPLAQECDVLNIPISYGYLTNPTAINIGNPHIIFFTNNIDKLDIENYGKYFENHPMFPEKTNVEFVEIIDNENIKVKVWERGAGETMACGSGACAVLAATILKGKSSSSSLNIHFQYGALQTTFTQNEEILISGKPTYVSQIIL